MTISVLHRARADTVRAAAAAALGVLTITSVHHIYGAALFDTPWRLHVVYASIPVALMLPGAARLGRAARNSLVSRLASWAFVILSGGFAVAAIGVYEGGYNHLLPNLQYVLGLEVTAREALYVPPDDLFFQLSGIAQFAAAIPAAWYLLKVFRERSGPAKTFARQAQECG